MKATQKLIKSRFKICIVSHWIDGILYQYAIHYIKVREISRKVDDGTSVVEVEVKTHVKVVDRHLLIKPQ